MSPRTLRNEALKNLTGGNLIVETVREREKCIVFSGDFLVPVKRGEA
jgi:hypothetical protein